MTRAWNNLRAWWEDNWHIVLITVAIVVIVLAVGYLLLGNDFTLFERAFDTCMADESYSRDECIRFAAASIQ